LKKQTFGVDTTWPQRLNLEIMVGYNSKNLRGNISRRKEVPFGLGI